MPDLMAARLMNTMTEYSSDEVTSVIQYGFSVQTNLESVSLPNCTYLGASAFAGCKKLYVASLPKLAEMSSYVFKDCESLIEFVTGETFSSNIFNNVFYGCSSLEKIDLYHVNNIGIQAGALSCPNLTMLIIRNTDFVPPLNEQAFAGATKMNTGEGKIYVPGSMVDAYKAASNWSNYADQIFSVEELTE